MDVHLFGIAPSRQESLQKLNCLFIPRCHFFNNSEKRPIEEDCWTNSCSENVFEGEWDSQKWDKT